MTPITVAVAVAVTIAITVTIAIAVAVAITVAIAKPCGFDDTPKGGGGGGWDWLLKDRGGRGELSLRCYQKKGGVKLCFCNTTKTQVKSPFLNAALFQLLRSSPNTAAACFFISLGVQVALVGVATEKKLLDS
jgi:hypothetical protein